MKERRTPLVDGSAGARIVSAVLVMVGVAFFAADALMFRRMDAAGVAVLTAIAVAALAGGLVLARRSGLLRGWVWSGRSWAELLTPGGPVRTPFEWIRVGIAAAVGAIVVYLVAWVVRVGAAWLNHASAPRTLASHSGALEQGVVAAAVILALLIALAALLLGAFAIVSLAIGIIGLGLRSGASSMSLRDWVSMDKRN